MSLATRLNFIVETLTLTPNLFHLPPPPPPLYVQGLKLS